MLIEWIGGGGTDPQTRRPLAVSDLRPNLALVHAIAAWKKLDSNWKDRVTQLQAKLHEAQAQPAAPAAAQDDKTRALFQTVQFLRSRQLYAATKARVGVSAALDGAPILRNLLALFGRSELGLLGREEIVRGLLAAMQDKGEEMRSIFSGLIQQHESICTSKELSWLYTELGIAHHKIAKTAQELPKQIAHYRLAIEQFSLASEYDEDNNEALRHWGWELDRLALVGDDAVQAQTLLQAVAKFDAALKIDPNLAEAYDNKGRSLRSLGRAAEARASFERCVAIDPEHIQALCALGELHKQVSDWDVAESYFRKALKANPKDAITTSKLALLFQKQAEKTHGAEQRDLFLKAVELHRAAIELDPNCVRFFSDCGYCFSRLRLARDARQMYDRGLAIDPSNAAIKKGLDFLKSDGRSQK
jgi:tetratricopeptide (TPR) repeat protein